MVRMFTEGDFLELISGRRRGPGATAARALLRGASGLYGFVTLARNRCFDYGWFRQAAAGIPVFSIGNLTTGGTGKTPVTATVVRLLQDLGQQPGIVSRGYRADSSGSNDERRVLDRLCPGVPHIQNPDRVTAVAELRARDSVSCVVLDDGFQHRRLARSLDMVLIDATQPLGYGFLLPRGLLRESPAALRRAHLVLITRCDQVSQAEIIAIERTVHRIAPRLERQVVRVSFPATHLLDHSGTHHPLDHIGGRRAAVMTAVGNPDAFLATCRLAGAEIVREELFPDHHHFTVAELRSVRTRAAEHGADIVLTTLKDFVKIPPNLPLEESKSQDSLQQATTIPWLAVETSLRFDSVDGEEIMLQSLRNALSLPTGNQA